jgi:hypothetical protein
MDEATIQKIAAEVVARLPSGDRYGLVVYVIVAALVGAVAALGTSYFRTRGLEVPATVLARADEVIE